MATDLDHDPLFVSVTASSFEHNVIADLAAGRCAAVVVPECISLPICREILVALSSVQFESYGTKRVNPPVMRFGTGVSDHRPNGVVLDSYWPAADASRKAWTGLQLPYEPFGLCRDALAKGWRGRVAVGTHRGRELGAGVAREPNEGFIVHFDDARREFEGNLLDQNIVTQFAFNLYISVAEYGGETEIWRHTWNPEDEAFRLPGSYGYSNKVIGHVESFVTKPMIGQALLFNPRYFHAVRPSREGRRIALGFSVGLTDSGDLLTWG